MQDGLELVLPDESATLRLGEALARALGSTMPPVPLLLSGGLGSGKTTLVRGLVSALPGAEAADVSSPSFNLVNIYPTRPQTAHFDLYRVAGQAPEEFDDYLDDAHTFVVAEWIENIPRSQWPLEAIHLVWHETPSGRALKISAWGKTACGLLESLVQTLNQWQKGL
jgi:tRNA threonylcarbamoyladenosine biosynthesis protein TsaE